MLCVNSCAFMRYKHLVIIGNGFDLDCGLKTSLLSYETYFYDNCERVMEEKGIACIDTKSPFEVTYGIKQISDRHDFWSAYEENLGRPDFKSLRLKSVEEQEHCLEDTIKLSDTVFHQWISDTYESGRNICKHGIVASDAFFLNFNYTPTLQEMFGADDTQVHHLHGRLGKGQRIIVGHNAGARNRPKKEWYDDSEIGRRCFIEDSYLYDTDKKTNWVKLRMTSNNVGQLSVNTEVTASSSLVKHPFETHEVKQVTVLGHSINSIDMTYFTYIHNKTVMNKPKWVVSCYCDEDRFNAMRLKSNLRLPTASFEMMNLADAAASVIDYY